MLLPATRPLPGDSLRKEHVMHTRFILMHTSHSGNVGAVARAMKVMGVDDLVLVQPRWADVLQRPETLERASGAVDVLEKPASCRLGKKRCKAWNICVPLP
jgi:tRNA G18 (ribose-2'-O)-methylase SpoU